MQTLFEQLKQIEVQDLRQKRKIKHSLSDIVGVALFATIANADDCVDIQHFGEAYLPQLQTYFPLKHGMASHDTIRRALMMIDPDIFQSLQQHFNNMLNNGEGEKIKKIIGIDGKTQCGNKTKTQKPNHIVSAIDEHGFSIAQKPVEDKTNEIKVIPKLLNLLNIKGLIVTIDAIGTQHEIAEKIYEKCANYVLALKANQKTLHTEVSCCFEDPIFLDKCKYFKTTQRARGATETREYWQSTNLRGISKRDSWAGLRSIVMTKNTITKDDDNDDDDDGGRTVVELRYFISSLPLNVGLIARAIRKHWMVESTHWHLDVTFREDADRTIDKVVACNINILRKLALNVLRLIDVGKKNCGIRKKRNLVGWSLPKYLEQILSI